jgi:acetolactate synthase-1/2/3 large subunit
MNGGGLVVAALLAHGVDTVFGIPGTHNLEIYRALGGSGIRHVTPRHEQGAGYAADGYARIGGRPGVAIVTTGPAVLNIAAAIGQAYSDSVPLLVISPGMPLRHRPGTGTLHETRDQSAAIAAVAGRSVRVTSAAEIPYAIVDAFAAFSAGRPRPIHLEIPYDVLAEEAEGGVPAPVVVRPRVPDPDLVAAAAAMLAAADRPLIVAGGGAKRANLVALAEHLSAPVLATINGKGTVPDRHPLAITAALHLPAVADLVADADVVLAIGTELAPTDFWNGPPPWPSRLIRVDVDPGQAHMNARAALPIVADAAAFTDALLGRLSPAGKPVEPARRADPADPRITAARAAVRAEADAESARWRPWLDVVTADIVAADNAMACYYGALNTIGTDRPGGFAFPTGYGTLGYALPAGIGAAIADPAARTVAICGDGGFMFSASEFATAAAERVPLPVIVFDNGGYGEIRAEMRTAGIAPLGVDLPVPDLVALARALGGHGVAPATPADLAADLTAAYARPGPTLILIKE